VRGREGERESGRGERMRKKMAESKEGTKKRDTNTYQYECRVGQVQVLLRRDRIEHDTSEGVW